MRPWIYRFVALLLALAGASLIALIWKAVYTTGRAADRLEFQLGMPLVLLITLAAAALIGMAAWLWISGARRRRAR